MKLKNLSYTELQRLFLNGRQPRPFFHLFSSFKQISNFTTYMYVKKYTVPGFELTTFGHESPPVNTGPGLPPLIAVDLASANRILCLKGCFKTGQSRPLFVFSFFSHSISNDNYLIWSIQIEKSLTLCLGFEPGSPERRCWRFHWAMAAALFKMYFLTFTYLFQLNGMMV